ncbi:MAG: DUF115 domain-containing protein [Phycisphaerales bacterium]|nr:DUF115 domain-containing protein [Phycisphaerales bacterium]
MTTTQSDPRAALVEPSSAVLNRNLLALSLASPRAAERVRDAEPADGVVFTETQDEGALCATMDGVALCSKRRPQDEAKRFAESVDFKSSGMIVVLGFGVGHHVRALVERIRGRATIVVFEPDVALLRSVMERVDCSFLARPDVVVTTDHENLGAISRSLVGHEPLLAMGTVIIEHAPSRSRLVDTAPKFARALTEYVGTVRMHMITTLVHSDVTVRNMLMNLDHYVESPGIADLKGAAEGRPAVVVSAGPSLRRNLHLLARPGVRDRVVIIAVQTVLRPMLEAGIRPHFVTALDYHEISRRFYEGLSAADVEGVTLVAEPKVNAAVLEAWPGAKRMPSDDFLATMLGDSLGGERGAIRAGATVAHLSYYLARHMGCDPVILIGQDLGFTDGQYYSKGAAIHDVWASELNAFNTLEMMEWQRIVRNRGHLHKAEDHLGREIYTDEQMRTYLAQFERDFMEDCKHGLRVIDATEGGVKKSHSEIRTLADALDEFAPKDAPRVMLPEPVLPVSAGERAAVLDRIHEVRRGVVRIASISRETGRLLKKMQETGDDEAALNKLIDRAHRMRDEVKSIEPAWTLMHRVNQAGVFNRIRADRAIAAEDGLTAREEQVRRIERDITNVRWIADASDVLEDLLGATLAVFDGGERRTRDLSVRETEDGGVEVGAATVRTGAFIIADHDRSALGLARDLDAPIRGKSALTRTIERLALCERIERITILSTDPARTRALIPAACGLPIDVYPYAREESRARSIASARKWASACWRGGLGFTTCYDEVLDPCALESAIEQTDLDAALVVGADWCVVDPGLCDAVIERHSENPEAHALAFSQAAPGLSGCVVSRSLVGEIASAVRKGALMSHLGGAVGYLPRVPRQDPIAKSHCVIVDPAVRDAGLRFIADEPESRAAIENAITALESRPDFGAGDVCAIAALRTQADVPSAPGEITIEITTARAGYLGSGAPLAMPAATALDLIRRIAEASPGALVTLGGCGDPLCHPEWRAIVDGAVRAGLGGVHVRTELRCAEDDARYLAASGVDIISVDLHADTESTYRDLTGADTYERVTTNIETILRAQDRSAGTPTPWLVPRITRRDAVYSEIELFFDRWTHYAGAAVIDQALPAIEGDRIEALGKPKMAAWRDWRRRMMIRVDGSVPADEFDVSSRVGNAIETPILDVWARLMATRRDAWRGAGASAPECRTGW